MARRKHISWKKKYACALLALGDVPYTHAREMTADQIISLYHVDHGILHETENENVDQYWNLTPRLIQAHRIKTKADAKIIAKSRRIRGKYQTTETKRALLAIKRANPHVKFSFRKIRSRGFDKTLRKKLDGSVVKRER